AGPSVTRTGAAGGTRPSATGVTDAGCHFSLTHRLTSGIRSINTSTEKYKGIMVIRPRHLSMGAGGPIIHPMNAMLAGGAPRRLLPFPIGCANPEMATIIPLADARAQ